MTTTPEWHTDAFPELRDGPPWVMAEMIEAEPALLEEIATSVDTAPLALLARTPGRLDVVGCGTSEHAALGVAEILTDAGRPATARQAFEARLDPGDPAGVIGVSHEGGTRATIDAMRAARAAGASVGLITAVADSEGLHNADAAIVTPMVDRSWCHTVGYTSPLAAGVALAANLSGTPVPHGTVQRLAEAGLETREQAAEVAAQLGGLARLIVVASGADRTAARELTLKVEEACHLPSAMRDLETFLHGHIPATGPDTGLVLIMTDRRQAAARTSAPRRCCGRRRESVSPARRSRPQRFPRTCCLPGRSSLRKHPSFPHPPARCWGQRCRCSGWPMSWRLPAAPTPT